MFNEHDELHLPPLVNAVARAVLRRAEEAKLALPVAKHVRLETCQLADLADREEFLNRFRRRAHRSCSGRSSRIINSPTASRARCPSKSTRLTTSTIGMSTSWRAASAFELAAVITPSATDSFPASASSSVAPFPISMP